MIQIFVTHIIILKSPVLVDLPLMLGSRQTVRKGGSIRMKLVWNRNGFAGFVPGNKLFQTGLPSDCQDNKIWDIVRKYNARFAATASLFCQGGGVGCLHCRLGKVTKSRQCTYSIKLLLSQTTYYHITYYMDLISIYLIFLESNLVMKLLHVDFL